MTRIEKRTRIKKQILTAPELSNRDIAKIIGCSPTTVGAVRRELANKNVQIGQVDTSNNGWISHPYFKENKEKLLDRGLSEKSLRALKADGVLDKMQERGSLSPRYCQRLLYLEQKKANKKHYEINEDDIKIFQADVRTGLIEQIKDESVDLVFVDPPYDRRAVETLYEHIANVSERILVDGGSLLVMCGGSHLDLVLEKLTKANKTLRFQWNISYICNRGTPYIHGRKVTTAVKNIIWLVKGKYTGPIQYDLINAPKDSGNTDKTYHKWGQNVEVVQEIIGKFTEPGDLVCDMMVGGGSTAVACIKTGRKFVGGDSDAEAVRISRKRVREMFFNE